MAEDKEAKEEEWHRGMGVWGEGTMGFQFFSTRAPNALTLGKKTKRMNSEDRGHSLFMLSLHHA